MGLRYAPLPGSFTVLSMLGFIVSAIYVNSGRLDASFGVAFMIVFGLMFIAALLSMTYGPVEESFELDKKGKKKKF